MARRPGGKTERRKARQRRTQRPTSTPSVSAEPTATAEPEVRPAAEPARRVTAPSAARAYTAASSSLTDRERAEYHYVERDLRNIGILAAVLAALLIVSYFVFNALGLTG